MAATDTTPDPIAVVLAAAADVLEQRGLTRDAYTDRNGRVCVLGALQLATLGEVVGPIGERSGPEAALFCAATARLALHWAGMHDLRWAQFEPFGLVIAYAATHDQAEVVAGIRAAAGVTP